MSCCVMLCYVNIVDLHYNHTSILPDLVYKAT
jgi:hypothetical protein